jgi:mannose-6-phosphate isomerase-like protein (cupin superfamily)
MCSRLQKSLHKQKVWGIIAELLLPVIKTSIFVNPHHSPTASQSKTLYGSETFQVRLLSLTPGESREIYPQPPVSQSQIFVIDGTLSLPNTTATKGQRIAANAEQPLGFTNQSSQPVTLIESLWGKDFEPVPLSEITETRPWGSFTVLRDMPDYKLKQLAVNPGNRLSLQRHQKREEHWLVTSGYPEVTLNDQVIKLSPGQYIHIPRHSWHRISNPVANNNTVVEIIELQLGDYFGEDDIERQQDDYGRS